MTLILRERTGEKFQFDSSYFGISYERTFSNERNVKQKNGAAYYSKYLYYICIPFYSVLPPYLLKYRNKYQQRKDIPLTAGIKIPSTLP